MDCLVPMVPDNFVAQLLELCQLGFGFLGISCHSAEQKRFDKCDFFSLGTLVDR